MGLPTDREAEGKQGMSHWSLDLVVDPIAYKGRGVCAEMLPRRMQLDWWRHPLEGTEIPAAPTGRAQHLMERTS